MVKGNLSMPLVISYSQISPNGWPQSASIAVTLIISECMVPDQGELSIEKNWMTDAFLLLIAYKECNKWNQFLIARDCLLRTVILCAEDCYFSIGFWIDLWMGFNWANQDGQAP